MQRVIGCAAQKNVFDTASEGLKYLAYGDFPSVPSERLCTEDEVSRRFAVYSRHAYAVVRGDASLENVFLEVSMLRWLALGSFLVGCSTSSVEEADTFEAWGDAPSDAWLNEYAELPPSPTPGLLEISGVGHLELGLENSLTVTGAEAGAEVRMVAGKFFENYFCPEDVPTFVDVVLPDCIDIQLRSPSGRSTAVMVGTATADDTGTAVFTFTLPDSARTRAAMAADVHFQAIAMGETGATSEATEIDLCDDSDSDSSTDCPIDYGVEQPLFISEYVEGSGTDNKRIEIYNPTADSVSLTHYTLNAYMNGTSEANGIDLGDGELAAGAVLTVCRSADDACDITSSDINHNGDDAYGLAFDGGGLMDVVGNIGEDTEWSVCGVAEATKDHTLVRRSTVTEGNTDWAASAGTSYDDCQWHVLDRDTMDYFGSHPHTDIVDPTPFSCDDLPTLTVAELRGGGAAVDDSITIANLHVTAIDDYGFWVQDSATELNSGLKAYMGSSWDGLTSDDAATIAIGDIVTMTGSVDEYNGLLEITPFAVEGDCYNLTVTGTHDLAPLAVDVFDLIGDSESYEGMFLGLTNVTVDDVAGSGSWTGSQWELDMVGTLTVDDDMYDAAPTLGAVYSTLVGVYKQNTTYSLLPRSADDAVLGSCPDGTELVDGACAPLYIPCPDGSAGETCTVCDPADTDCVETADLKECTPWGTCGAPPADLFYSEFAEGSSSNKYFEIHNPSGSQVDLADYAFLNCSNSSCASSDGSYYGPSEEVGYQYWTQFADGATIEAGGTYTVCHSSFAGDSSVCDESRTLYFNGNDSQALVWGDSDHSADMVVLDLLGTSALSNTYFDVCGESEGHKDNTIVRKSAITSGTSDWAASAGTNKDDCEWIVFNKDTWVFAGSHPHVATASVLEFEVNMLQIDGVAPISTAGGEAQPGVRTVYMFAPDTDDTPTYSGGAWPFVYAAEVVTSDGVNLDRLGVNGDGVLFAETDCGPRALYQYAGDDVGFSFAGDGVSNWSSIDPSTMGINMSAYQCRDGVCGATETTASSSYDCDDICDAGDEADSADCDGACDTGDAADSVDCIHPCDAAGARSDWIGDGFCDLDGEGAASNNIAACDYDGGDCCPSTCVDGTEYVCAEDGGDCLTCVDPDAADFDIGGVCYEDDGGGDAPTCPFDGMFDGILAVDTLSCSPMSPGMSDNHQMDVLVYGVQYDLYANPSTNEISMLPETWAAGTTAEDWNYCVTEYELNIECILDVGDGGGDSGGGDACVDFGMDGGCGADGGLIISEIADPSDFADGRFIELYNTSNTMIDLADYELHRWTNAGTTAPSGGNITALDGDLAPGEFFILCNDLESFDGGDHVRYPGVTCDLRKGSGPVDSNGDDKIALVDIRDDSLVDMIGIVGTSSAGTSYYWQDGHMERLDGVCTGSDAWDASEWIVMADPEYTSYVSDMTPGAWSYAPPTCD